jgi:hypothetical protein
MSSKPHRNIPIAWLVDLPDEEKKDFEQAWRNSTYVLNKLKAIIERRIDSLEFDREQDYNHPQWPVLRADRNGQARALMDIFRLLP